MGLKLTLVLLFLLNIIAYGQRGLLNDPNINAARTVNEYTSLTADATAGSSNISVVSSTLNSNSRFSNSLQPGELVLIIQMQGASVNLVPNPIKPFDLSGPSDSSYGTITNYNNCGNHEYRQVKSIPNATSIELDCPLEYNYTAAGKVQVIRVPRYKALTILAGGNLTCDIWNGTTGGILAIEVLGNITINGTGKMDVSSKGFRGGIRHRIANIDQPDRVWGMNKFHDVGAQGEGIAGDTTTYKTLNAMYGIGAIANGGGGGGNKSCGAGGGGNGGIINNYFGSGVPDISTANFITAWNREYNGFASITSSGGGRGGYGYTSLNRDELLYGPGNAQWGSAANGYDRRLNNGGRGGRPLDYSTGKIFMGGGGGGGAGDRALSNNDARTAGGNGGGIISILSYGAINGNGSIIANGASVTQTTRDDGCGGAGAGGTIVINSQSNVASTIQLTANGGVGGIQDTPPLANESEGPGGGGSGGYIAITGGTPVTTVNGGNNGTTDAGGVTNFPPNGATRGAVGSTNTTLPKNLTILSGNTTVCIGNNATLNATLSGNVPAGAVVTWYDAAVGGNVLNTGSSYTVNNVTSTLIVYVGTCPGSYRFPDTIKVTTSLPLTLSTKDTSVCSGNGVNISASGATSYSWSPSLGLSSTTIANPIAFPSIQTTYTVTASDANGCTAQDTVRIKVKPKPTINLSGNFSICRGDTSILVAGGTSTFSWSTSGNTNFSFNDTIRVSPSSTTTFTFAGSTNGCFDQKTQVVNVINLPNINISNSSPIRLCPGDSVQLNVIGGNSYSWSPDTVLSQTTGTTVYATPEVNTVYTVNGSDGTCSNKDTISVFVKPVSGVTFNPLSPSICPGQSATISASGNTNYSWFSPTGNYLGSNTSITVSPASDSTYILTFNSNGCNLGDTIRVNVGNSINVIATVSSDSICVGDNVVLTAQNGSNHTWSSDPSLATTTGSSVTASPTVSTSYTVTGGSGLCSDTGIVNVVVLSSNVSISSPQSLICKYSSVTLTGSGANSYSWSTGETTSSITVSPSTNTSYTLTGDGGGGLCPSITIKTINVDTTRIRISGLNAICDGQANNLTATGGSNYSWSTGQTGPSITPIINGNTTITLYGNNTNGCLDTNTFLISTTSKPNITITGNDSICSGASTTLTANGANLYSWQNSATFNSNNTQNVSPTVNTSYIVYGDLNGCVNSDTISIIVLASPNINGISNFNLCIGSSANILLNGSPNYTWQPTTGLTFNNDSNAIATPLTSTSYTIIGGINTCKDTFIVNLNVDLNPVTLSVVASEDSLCSNQSSNITANGALTYLWTPSAGLNNTTSSSVIATPTANTIYTVIGTNNFCKDTSYISLKVLNTPTISVSPLNAGICSGKSITLNSSGNATSYSWSPAATLNSSTGTTVIANPTSNTAYTVIGFNEKCSDSAYVDITVSNPVNISSNTTSSSICSGANTNLNVTGAPNYSWIPAIGINNPSSGNVTASPLTNTNYTVVGYNAGCSDTVYINVSVLPALNLNVNASNTNICKGDNTTLTATSSGGSNTYTWFPNVNLSNTNTSNVTASPIGSQLYTVIATNGQCFDTATIYIQVLSGITTSISASPTAVCAGNSSNLTASGAINYSWTNTGASSTSIIVSPATTTIYTAIGFNGSCIDTAYYNLIVHPLPTITTIPDQSIAIGSSVSLIASGGVSYIWTPADNLSCTNCPNPFASPPVTTTYLVVGTDSKGCTNSASVTVKVDENYVLFIPSAFSPNNDGENDILFVRGRGIKEMNIVIFNGWGEKVFESDSQLVGWDGTRNGAELNSGVFVYQIKGKYYNGTEFNQKGDITLMK